MKYNPNKCQSTLLKGYSGCLCSYCTAYSKLKGKWIIDVKGDRKRSGEISVLRENNRHGIASYGWFNENKYRIFDSDGPVEYFIWRRHIKTANIFANALNSAEQNETTQTL